MNKKEYIYFLKWLKENHSNLLDQANINDKIRKDNQIFAVLENRINQTTLLFQSVWLNIFSDSKMFNGESFVTQEAQEQADITSRVVSGATLFNAISNTPILFYAFRHVGTLSAIPLAFTLNIIILSWTNQTGIAAARDKKGNKLWSTVGILSFFMMSAVQSIISGVGVELLHNQEILSYSKAEELIDQRLDNFDVRIQFLNQQEESAQLRCAKEAEEYRLNPSDTKYIDTYGGTYNVVQNRDFENFTNPEAACSPLELEKNADEVSQLTNEKSWLQNNRYAINNDLVLLQALEEFSRLERAEKSGVRKNTSNDERNIEAGDIPVGDSTFSRYFEKKDSTIFLKSGTEAVSRASERFLNNLGIRLERESPTQEGRFSNDVNSGADRPEKNVDSSVAGTLQAIGLSEEYSAQIPTEIETSSLEMSVSVLFFVLSMVTSLSATLLIAAYPKTKEAQTSRNSEVKTAIEFWLETIRRQYIESLHKNISPGETKLENDNDLRLISLYIDEYLKTGRCEYPAVQALGKMTQEGFALKLIKHGGHLPKKIDKTYAAIGSATAKLFELLQTQKQLNKIRKTPDSLGEIVKKAAQQTVQSLTGESKIDIVRNDPDMELAITYQKNIQLIQEGLIKVAEEARYLVLISHVYVSSYSLQGGLDINEIKKLEKSIRETIDRIIPQASLFLGNSYLYDGSWDTHSPSLKKEILDLVKLQCDCSELAKIMKEHLEDLLTPLFMNHTSFEEGALEDSLPQIMNENYSTSLSLKK